MKRLFCKHSWKYSYSHPDVSGLGKAITVNVYKCLKCSRMKRVTMPRGAGE